jgi:large subunit ribosomal protein L31e
MAEKETKKLEEFKENEENKKAVAEAEGKSKPAVEKASKKEAKVEKIELEREYVIPLRKGVLKAPRYRRAKKAIRIIREFLARHMRVENRDLSKIKVNIHLNNEIWFRGIKKPANKIKVKAIKKGGIVYAELAEVPEKTQYKISREIKRAANVKNVKMPKHEEKKQVEDKDKDGISDKVEEQEEEKAVVEAGLKKQKAEAKSEKHTAKAKGTKEDNTRASQRRETKK